MSHGSTTKGEVTRRAQRWARAYELSAAYRLHNRHFRRLGLLEAARLGLEYQFLPHYFGYPPAWRLLLRKLGGRRVLPDFALVGTVKSGTSDIAVSLVQHPCVAGPLSKEFRSDHAESWRIFYPTVTEQEKLARRAGVARAGYFTPRLHELRHIASFARAMPRAKIIISLRDPVERAFSHFKWEVLMSSKKAREQLDFLQDYGAFCAKALDFFPDYPMYSACGYPFLTSGIYYKAVEVWTEYFGAENVLVLDAGQYFRDRQAFLDRAWSFIGVPPFSAHAEARAIVNENPLQFPPPDPATVRKLAAFYQPYNEKLFERLGQRFDWQTPASPPAKPATPRKEDGKTQHPS